MSSCRLKGMFLVVCVKGHALGLVSQLLILGQKPGHCSAWACLNLLPLFHPSPTHLVYFSCLMFIVICRCAHHNHHCDTLQPIHASSITLQLVQTWVSFPNPRPPTIVALIYHGLWLSKHNISVNTVCWKIPRSGFAITKHDKK